MEILRHAVVLVHLTGFAVLFGAWVVEAIGRRRITRLMTWGMVIAAVAGLALAAPWGIEYSLNYAKLGTKLVVLLAIGAVLGIGTARQRKSGTAPAALFWLVGILTFLNAAIAVLWR
ncbi:Fe-S protein [Microbacterium sp. MMO-56]|uniref:Fe-S protein n=1 Tax=Microbacterium sp. MMO-56 TaxID=3081281 RepID=UPI003016BCD5